MELPKRRLTVFTGVSGSARARGVRDDRRRVAAAHQRDIQRVRPRVHADARAARGRRARWHHDRDPRRPGTHGRWPALHRRHRNRRERDAADPVQPARRAARRVAERVLVQRAVGVGERRDDRRARGEEDGRRELHAHGRDVSALRGHGHRVGLRSHRAVRRQQVARRGRPDHPRLHDGRLVRAHLPRLRVLRHHQADRQVHEARTRGSALQGADEDQGRGHQPHVRGRDPEDPEVDALQGHRRAPAARARVRGTGRHARPVPGVRRHAPERRGARVEDRRDQHRRRLRDADHRPRGPGSAACRSPALRRSSRRCRRRSTPSSRSGSATSASTDRRARCRAARRSARR